MTKHKRHVSESEDPWNPLFAGGPRTDANSSTTTFASTGCNPNRSSTGLYRSVPKTKEHGQLLKELIPADNNGLACASPGGSSEGPTSPTTLSESNFYFQGQRVKLKHSHNRICWKGLNNRCCGGKPVSMKIPYEEVLSAWMLPRDRCCSCSSHEFGFILYALGRQPGKPAEWSVQEHCLYCPTLEMAKEWVTKVNATTQLDSERPRNLLVFVNPFSGRKNCMQLFKSTVAPILHRSRIKYTLVETTRQDHAKETVAYMKLEEMSQYQGIVAVGGDGLFQELVMGLMLQRGKGSGNAAIAQKMRLGHIPGGSTDACAYSLHGTRSAEAAVLHIVIGDRMPLDVARVVSRQDSTHKYFVCQAAYGFLGDVLKLSEGMRALGPSRYDIAGACKFMQLNSYKARVTYQRAPPSNADSSPSICSHRCEVCREASVTPASVQLSALASFGGRVSSGGLSPMDDSCTSTQLASTPSAPGLLSPLDVAPPYTPAHSQLPPLIESPGAALINKEDSSTLRYMEATSGGDGGYSTSGGGTAAAVRVASNGGEPWTTVEGQYMSIMAVVIPCRSHMSKKGIIPYGHLSDGRLYLVLVSKCSHIQWLYFLLTLSGEGLLHECLPYVQVIPCTGVSVQPMGDESSWNIDGELLSNNTVDISIQRGLVDVFGRGVELVPPSN